MSGAPIDDGGFAFPHTPDKREPVGHGMERFTPGESPGMTLRDYFAAKAMQGILAGDHPITHELDACNIVPRVAYDFADAMLKARQS